MEEYVIKELSMEEFSPIWEKESKKIFKEEQIFRSYELLSGSEREFSKGLKEKMGSPIKINFCVFHKEKLVGWSWGYQESAGLFYMCNSAILSGHRRKGLYTNLLYKMVERVENLGFQKVYSRHSLTNNSVIIPKLKAGFVITTMEVNDVFGSLVHLTYYKNKIRNKVLNYRVGLIKPGDEIKKLLQF